MTQAGEHNPYNPSHQCTAYHPQPALSLSLSLSGTQKIFISSDQAATSPPRGTRATLWFWSEGRKFYFRWSVSKPKLKPERGFSTPDTDSQPQRSWSGRTQTTHHSERTRATRGPCRGCHHQNLQAPNQRCPGCNHLQRSRTGSARCAASCCTSPLYLHAATPFAFGALTGVCLTLAYRSVHCVDRNSRTCLASANCCTTC